MSSVNRAQRYAWFFAMLVVSLLLDQGTKVWARKALRFHSTTVVKDYFDFHLAQNTGGAFSMLGDLPHGPLILTVSGVLILVAIFVYMHRAADARLVPAAALGLIAGSAIGNLYDRVNMGSVTDFIYWHVHQHSWPIFNIADALLLVGVGLLLLVGTPRK